MLNKKKTLYTIFCTSGLRTNYYRTYSINLRIKDTSIPLEPHPIFLGITLDPKLNFKKHLESIETKLSSKVNLFKNIKSLRINHIKINTILFKSLIRSIFDYAFIILNCPTQRILNDLQKMQNRILRSLKYFPLRTKSIRIHSFFNLQTIEKRSLELLKKFSLAKRDHNLLQAELEDFKNNIYIKSRKLHTTFDKMLQITLPSRLGEPRYPPTRQQIYPSS